MKKLMLLATLCLVFSHNKLFGQAVGSGRATTISRSSSADRDDDRGNGELRTHKTKLGNSKDKQVIISLFNSELQIVGHNSDDVVIETRSYTAPPKQAEGLKAVYNQAEDNTNLGLGITKEGNALRITKASRHGGKYTIRVPKNASVVYKETNWMGGNFTLSDVDGEIEVKLNNGSATLTNVSGPIVANTTNGSLKIKFDQVNQGKPSSISTINGSIDITMPANTKSDLKIKSITGEIYTDFDLNLKKDPKSDLPRVGGGNNIDGKTNGGGVEMNIYTINSDIFIRKAK